MLNDTGLSSSDGVTSEPTVSGSVASTSELTAIRAAVDAIPPDGLTPLDLALIQPDGSFLLDRVALENIAANPLSDGEHTLYLQAEGQQADLSDLFHAAGQRIEQLDALGRSTRFVYDERGRSVETILPDDSPTDNSDNPRTATEYDAAGRSVATVDEPGRRTEYVYHNDDAFRLRSGGATGRDPFR